MRIGTASIRSGRSGPVTHAPVSIDTNGGEWPAELCFEYHDGDEAALSTLADAFLIALLPIAMRLGEDIRVEGPVSTPLAFGLESWQVAVATWYPGYFARVAIDYEQLVDGADGPRPPAVGCCFSGGVDSWYSVWKHLPAQQPLQPYQLSHALMINGFDQVDDARTEGAGQGMFAAYAPVLGSLGVELIMVSTNLRRFRSLAFDRNRLVRTYGSSLIACGHALGMQFGRFAVSASAAYAWEDLWPDGSHHVLDHLLGTDRLQILRAGGDANRSRKLEQLADVPEVQHSLRVCFRDPEFDPRTGQVRNCGECEKCIRTISALDMIGRLEAFTTLSRRPPVSEYKRPEVLVRSGEFWLKDNLALARRLGRSDWIPALEEALRRREEIKRQSEAGAV
jgi:hypothetical protein